MEFLLLVAICAIVILSVACSLLWMGLARTKKALHSRKGVDSMDNEELLETLLGRLPTIRPHQRYSMCSVVRQHTQWYDRSVDVD